MKPCKVCKCKNKELFEELYVKKVPVTKIYETSILLGESFSIGSLYRHFKNHIEIDKHPDFSKKNLLDNDEYFRIIYRTLQGLSREEQLGFIRWWKQSKGNYFNGSFYDKYSLYDEIIKILKAFKPSYIEIFNKKWIELWNSIKYERGHSTFKTWNEYYGYDINDIA